MLSPIALLSAGTKPQWIDAKQPHEKSTGGKDQVEQDSEDHRADRQSDQETEKEPGDLDLLEGARRDETRGQKQGAQDGHPQDGRTVPDHRYHTEGDEDRAN